LHLIAWLMNRFGRLIHESRGLFLLSFSPV
jgi:hypothetical protein